MSTQGALPAVPRTPSSADSDKISLGGVEKTGTIAHHPTVALANEYGINDKAIVRRIDVRIIPVMAVLYLLSFVRLLRLLIKSDASSSIVRT